MSLVLGAVVALVACLNCSIFPSLVHLRHLVGPLRDLSEISRGGGGVGILNLGSEIRRPIPAMAGFDINF